MIENRTYSRKNEYFFDLLNAKQDILKIVDSKALWSTFDYHYLFSQLESEFWQNVHFWVSL